mgnify:CR=1 FL=1
MYIVTMLYVVLQVPQTINRNVCPKVGDLDYGNKEHWRSQMI